MTIRKLFSNLSVVVGYIFLTVITYHNITDVFMGNFPNGPIAFLKIISIAAWMITTSYFVIIFSISVQDYLDDQHWYMKLRTQISDFLDTKIW